MDLLTLQDGDVERRYELTGDVTSIGRSSENDIQISEPLSSRFHCQVERAGDGFKLVDLESQNGTMVNGRKVNSRKLEPDDLVEIGQVRLRYTVEKESPALKPLRRKRPRKVPKRRRTRIAPEETDLDERFSSLLRDIQKSLGADGLRQAGSMFRDFLEDEEGADLLAMEAYKVKLEKLVEINQALSTEFDKKKLLAKIMDSAVILTSAERGFIVLLENGELKIEVARNFDKESIRKPAFKISHSIAERVASTGRPVLASDARNDDRFRGYMSVSNLRLRSVLCIPLKIRNAIGGVLYMDNRFKEGVFSPDDMRILETFGHQASIAIENAMLHEENVSRQEELRETKENVERLNVLLSKKVEDQKAVLAHTQETLEQNQREFTLKYNYDNIVGTSKPMREIFRLLDRITDSDVSVLIHGRSGTGKELVARAIHFNGPRKKMPFVSINCAAISDTLLESELFGHVRGAFTGAVTSKKGLFEVADNGTLFLDEIGEMSTAMQKKLLRAIQEGEIRPVGGKDARKVNVRILSASNLDLGRLVEERRFREDLFYRLNVVQVNLPELKERKEDIPLLIDHFLTVIAAETRREKLQVSRDALRLLVNHTWPGNVRELENEMRRVHALSEGMVEVESLSETTRLRTEPQPLDVGIGRPLKEVVKASVEKVESEMISQALAKTGWKKSETAKLLGISRPTLDAKISQYGLRRE